MVRSLRVVVLGLMLAALLGCQPRWLRPPLSGEASDVVALADPGVLVVGTRTYVVGTNRSPANVPLLRAGADTHTFSALGDALPDPPAWARTRNDGGAFWAPSLARLDGRYVLYFSARHRNVPASRPGWCIGVAVADTPEGPYQPRSSPLFCAAPKERRRGTLTRGPVRNRGAIDPQIYRRGRRSWLHFKALDHPWQLWAVELSSDGLRTIGQGRGLIKMHSQEAEWEYSRRERFTVLENPSMDHNPDGIVGAQYYLYYSGDDWRSDNYATGIAACRTPVGPCLRTTDPPWLRTRGMTGGPGGLTVTRDRFGQKWAFYHGWVETDARRRVLHVEPLAYDGITPVLLSQRPTATIAITQPEPTDQARFDIDGTASDPDRPGVEVAYQLTVDDQRVVKTWTVDGRFHAEISEQYGLHTVCLDLRDDFRSGWTRETCIEIDGGPEPAPQVVEEAPTTTTEVPPTTTAPPTTSTTIGTPDSTTTIAAWPDGRPSL